MRNILRVLVCLLCIAPAVRAQQSLSGVYVGQSYVAHVAAEKPSVAHRIGHYVNTHKALLATDTLILLAHGADAGSTVHGLRDTACCFVEKGSAWLIGRYPSNAAVWGASFGVAALFIAGNHVIRHLTDGMDPWEKVFLLDAAPSVVAPMNAAIFNVDLINRLEHARNQLK